MGSDATYASGEVPMVGDVVRMSKFGNTDMTVVEVLPNMARIQHRTGAKQKIVLSMLRLVCRAAVTMTKGTNDGK